MLPNSDPNNMHVITENGEQCFMWRSNQLTYIAQDRRELPQVLATKFGPLATKLDLSYNSLTSFRNINLFTNLSELVLDNNCLEDDQLVFKQNLRLKTLSLNKNKLADLYKLISSIKACFPNLEFLSLIGNPLCPSPISSWSQLAGGQVNNIRTAPPIYDAGGCCQESDVLPAAASLDPASNEQGTASVSSLEPSGEPTTDGLYSGATARILSETNEQHTDFAYRKYRYFIIYHLPNLRFLDSSPISDQEREEALKRCYWMETSPNNEGNLQQATRVSSVACQQNADRPGSNDSNNNNNNNGFQLTIIPDYAEGATRQHMDELEAGGGESQPRGAFSRLSYKYTGKNSEGNRFIRNQDL